MAACAAQEASPGCIQSVVHLNETTRYHPIDSSVRHACGLSVEEPAAQHPGVLPAGLMALLAGYVAVRFARKPQAVLPAVAAGYLYMDLHMTVLHLFLDTTRALQHPLAFVRAAASEFQTHHRYPGVIISWNHVAAADTVASAGLLALACWSAAAAARRGCTTTRRCTAARTGMTSGGSGTRRTLASWCTRRCTERTTRRHTRATSPSSSASARYTSGCTAPWALARGWRPSGGARSLYSPRAWSPRCGGLQQCAARTGRAGERAGLFCIFFLQSRAPVPDFHGDP